MKNSIIERPSINTDTKISEYLELRDELRRAEERGETDTERYRQVHKRLQEEDDRHWQKVSAIYPELASYQGLDEALAKTALKLSVPFPDLSNARDMRFIFTANDGSVRSIQVFAWESTKNRFHIEMFDYDVEDCECVVYDGYTISLEEITRLVSGWIVERHSIETLRNQFSWLSKPSVRGAKNWWRDRLLDRIEKANRFSLIIDEIDIYNPFRMPQLRDPDPHENNSLWTMVQIFEGGYIDKLHLLEYGPDDSSREMSLEESLKWLKQWKAFQSLLLKADVKSKGKIGSYFQLERSLVQSQDSGDVDLNQQHQTQLRSRDDKLWQSTVKGFPELNNYTSIVEALEKTSLKLDLSFPNLTKPQYVSGDGQFIFGVSDETRTVQIFPFESISHYKVQVFDYSLEEYNGGVCYFGHTPSLGETAQILSRWIVERCSINSLHNQFSWLPKDPLSVNFLLAYE